MSTPNFRVRTSKTRQPSRTVSRRPVGGRGPLTAMFFKMAARIKDTESAELLEFALALPLILVMVVGLLDFSHAYNIQQKLANAAREGARIGGSESATDTSQTNPPSVQDIYQDVTTYLQDAGINTSFIGTTLSWTPTPVSVGTYYTTQGGVNYGLKIERNVQVKYTDPNTSNQVTLQATRVTLYYPYDWTFGFNQIIKLLVPSATFSNPIRIETDAMMANP